MSSIQRQYPISPNSNIPAKNLPIPLTQQESDHLRASRATSRPQTDPRPAVTAVMSSEIKFPPFWKATPDVLFSTLEAQLSSRNLISDDQMYFNTIKNLGCDVMREIADTISTVPDTGKYVFLKQALLRKYEERDKDRIKRFFDNLTMGSKSSSRFLEFLMSVGKNTFRKESILKIWCQGLPSEIYLLLGSEVTVDNQVFMVRKADDIHTVMKRNSIAAVESARTDRDEHSQKSFEAINSRLDKLELQIKRLLDSAFASTQTPDQKSRARSKSRGRSGNPNVGQTKEDTKGLCFYHARFGAKAHRCLIPCKWDAGGIDPVKRVEALQTPKVDAFQQSLRLFLKDKITKLSFLIDSGAEVSCLPNTERLPVVSKLYAANLSPINTYGKKNITIDFGYGHKIDWDFVIADIPYPILGGDILLHYNLLPDLANKQLINRANFRDR